MASWRFASGTVGMRSERDPDSPALFLGTAFVFELFGPSDAAARLLPAVAGSALVLTPWLLRKRIGHTAALATSLFLALSPTMLAISRQVDGAALAVLGSMVALGCLFQLLETRDRRWLIASMAGLALTLSSSPLGWGVSVTLGLSAIIAAWSRRFRCMRGLQRDAPSWAVTSVLSFGAGLFVVAGGLGWHMKGLANAADLLPVWISDFGPGTSVTAAPLLVLVLYDFLPLALGIAGVACAFRGGQTPGAPRVFVLWASLGIITLFARPTAGPGEAAMVLVPVALLAGVGAQELVDSAPGLRTCRGRQVALFFAGPAIWGYASLVLAHYANQGRPQFLVLLALALSIQALILISVVYLPQRREAMSALACGWAFALVLATVSVGWGATQVRPGEPSELVWPAPTDAGVRRLRNDLQELSWRMTGAPQTLAFTYDATASECDDILAWYIRDFRDAAAVDRAGVPAEVHVACGSLDTVPQHIGQDYPFRRTWNRNQLTCSWQVIPECRGFDWLFGDATMTDRQVCAWYERLDCRDPIDWLLFRSVDLQPPRPEDTLVLWLRREDDTWAGSGYTEQLAAEGSP